MPRASRVEWEKRVRRWKDSGLSAKEYAAETGLNATTLANWHWKLSQSSAAAMDDDVEVASSPMQSMAQAAASATSAARFVELRTSPADEQSAPLELVMSRGLRVRVPAGFDEATLMRLVRAVESAR
jgi:transposase